MTNKQKNDIFEIQKLYDNKVITFQEFKEKFIAKLIGYSDVKDIENIVSFLLEN